MLYIARAPVLNLPVIIKDIVLGREGSQGNEIFNLLRDLCLNHYFTIKYR